MIGGNLNRTIGCDTRNCANSKVEIPPSYIYRTVNMHWDSDTYSRCSSQGPTCGYVLSQWAGTDGEKINYIGLSSKQYSAEISKARLKPENINYSKNIVKSEISESSLPIAPYSDAEAIYGTSGNEYVYSECLYREENTPEFYAVLPMIKI